MKLASAAAMLCALLCGACIEAGAMPSSGLDEPRTTQRTVSIAFLRTAERTLELDADGVASYADAVPRGGVEICVIGQRPAFAAFAEFEAPEAALCTTNAAEQTALLAGVPADSDLLVSFAKPGYRSVLTTFRSDAHDVAVPIWADNETYFVPLVPSDHALPTEQTAAGVEGAGLVAISVEAVGDHGVGPGSAQFFSGADYAVAPAEGVVVEVVDDTEIVLEQATRRDRPLFVPLPEGSYRMRFTHPDLELVPFGVQEQFMIAGFPTDATDVIEVPVRADHLSLAVLDAFCPLPADPTRLFEDLSTCTLDAGGPEP